MKKITAGKIKLSISNNVHIEFIDDTITRISINALPTPQGNIQQASKAILRDTRNKLEQLIIGTSVTPKFKLSTDAGTSFQKKVWRQISKIPFGETISYSELAKKIGKPKAVRAVANACGANPFPLIIPCHRVIAKDGSLGGFSCGIEVKRALLKLERKFF